MPVRNQIFDTSLWYILLHISNSSLLKQDVFYTSKGILSRPAALLFLCDCIALTSSSSLKSLISIGSVSNTFSIGWSSMTGGWPVLKMLFL